MRKCITFFVFLLYVTLIYTQELAHVILNSDNGLPSNKVNNIFQDSKGYIWFATENGLCRWDSKNFKTFTIQDGLPSNEVYSLAEDKYGRLWISTFSQKISYIKNDTVYTAKNDTNLQRISISPASSFYPYNEFLYYSSSENKNYCRYNFTTNSISKLAFFFPSTCDYYVIHDSTPVPLVNVKRIIGGLDLTTSSLFFVDSQFNIFNAWSYKLGVDTLLFVDKLRKEQLLLKIFDYKKFASTINSNYAPVFDGSKKWVDKWIGRYVSGNMNSELLIAKKFSKFKPRTNLIDPSFCQILSRKHLDSLPIFSGILKKNLIYVYNYSIEIGTGKTFFHNSSKINGVGELKKTYLFLRLTEGVEYIPSFNIQKQKKVEELEYPIHKLIKLKNDIILIPEKNNLYNFSKKQFLKTTVQDKPYNVFTAGYNLYLTTSKQIINLTKEGNIQPNVNMIYSYFKNTFYLERNQKCYLSRSINGILEVNNLGSTKNISMLPAYVSHIDAKNRIWIGTPDKLYVAPQFSPKVVGEKEVKLNPNINVFCSEITEDKKGNLFFTTNDGIYIIDNKNQKYHLSDKNLLSSNESKTLKLDTINNTIIIATRNGINQIKYTEKNNKLSFDFVNRFFKTDGLSSNEIQDILIEGDSLWVASGKSLDLIFNRFLTPDTTSIPIHITQISVNEKPIKYDSAIELKHNENNISIDFSAIYFLRRDRLKIQYRLIENGDTSTRELQGTNINLLSLASGKYQLQLYAYDQDYPYNRSFYRNLYFIIQPPFYKTWWFISLTSISILALILGSFWYRNKLKFEKLKAESEVHRLTLHGLQNQMNPHFVFNILNTLQYFILRKDKEFSLNFLSDFSSLIRKILDNSREEFISLEEEIAFLEQYSSIELERYNHNFEIAFRTNIDSDELSDIKIPPMVIQPLIENAVKHGVSMKERGGKIEVSFNLIHLNLLEIIVQDNGDSTIEKKSDTSKAITILTERVQLIQKGDLTGSFHLTRKDNHTLSILRIPI